MKHSKMILIILLFCFSFSTVSCNLLSWIDNNVEKTRQIEGQLNESGMVMLREVVTTRDIVSVSIEMTTSDALADQFMTWVSIFDNVLEVAPDVQLVVISLFFMGESYLQVSANAEDIKAFLDETIAANTFFDRLSFDDQRLPDLVLRQELEKLGWIVTSVLIDDDRIEIEAFPPDAENHADIVVDWVDAMALVADHAADAEQIILHLLLVDTPNLSLTVNKQDLVAFQNGEMDALNFLSNWTVSD